MIPTKSESLFWVQERQYEDDHLPGAYRTYFPGNGAYGYYIINQVDINDTTGTAGAHQAVDYAGYSAKNGAGVWCGCLFTYDTVKKDLGEAERLLRLFAAEQYDQLPHYAQNTIYKKLKASYNVDTKSFLLEVP